ncbi:MAG: hypothetical protein WAW42_10705, partial [Candidatus Competibacteraceae bacterium]
MTTANLPALTNAIQATRLLAAMACKLLREAASLMLPPDLASPQGALFAQFEFMKKIGLLPPDAGWRTIGERIDTSLLPELVREGDRW